tara:strand:- start:872 stop:2155 length:1284 start_codon:yes stop_codon:yes gene_type:complete
MLTCDPWIGKSSDNAWYSYPIKNENEIDPKIFNSNFIYISHLHSDHFDEKTLKKFKNKNLKFIIKKFNNGHLKKRLERFTNKKIIELEPFKKKKINKDFSVAIIPQIISNVNNYPEDIHYDLDTSIVVQSNKHKTVFYNNVDMPLNIKVLKIINNFIKKEFKKKIDIFCYPIGAASEFPQSFLNLNRNYEKIRIIKKSLSNLKLHLKYLKPKIFFPAGGTYVIYGKFNKLNKYIAQPNFEQMQNTLKNMSTKIYNIIGGGSITYDKSKYSIIEKVNTDNTNVKRKFIKKVKNLNYYYNNKEKKIDINQLDQNFLNAKYNYNKILSKKKINNRWNIDFNIFRNLELNDKCNINKKKSKFIKKYNLKNYNLKSKNISKLECFIEYKLFKSLLLGKFAWNTSLAGSTIMYKRKPNKHNVNMIFSLNFLRI